MEIQQAEFVSSITDVRQLTGKKLPEFAFIGRSNVGKSSLINMLTGRKSLAKVSGTPGKTQTINHYSINQSWYLVDLPGYGFASVSKGTHQTFGKIIDNYIRDERSLCGLTPTHTMEDLPLGVKFGLLNPTSIYSDNLSEFYTEAYLLPKIKVVYEARQFGLQLRENGCSLPCHLGARIPQGPPGRCAPPSAGRARTRACRERSRSRPAIAAPG